MSFVDFIEAFYAPVHHLLARSLRARADQQETSIWVAEIPRHVVRALPVPERNASQALKTLSAPMSVRFLMHGGLVGSGDRRRKPQDHQFPGHGAKPLGPGVYVTEPALLASTLPATPASRFHIKGSDQEVVLYADRAVVRAATACASWSRRDHASTISSNCLPKSTMRSSVRISARIMSPGAR
jgi:hypothetical protein